MNAEKMCDVHVCVIYRETREGWPLATVETKAYGDSKRTNERGPFFLGWEKKFFFKFMYPDTERIERDG
jgi:hypothetical protein